MRRTISKNVFLRMAAQAEEAENYEDYKSADALTSLVKTAADNHKVRDEKSDKNYKYDKDSLKEDISDLVWKACERVFDYYDGVPDVREIKDLVHFITELCVENVEKMMGKEGVGPYEEATPGEKDWKITGETVSSQEGNEIILTDDEDEEEDAEDEEDTEDAEEDEVEMNDDEEDEGKDSLPYGRDRDEDEDVEAKEPNSESKGL